MISHRSSTLKILISVLPLALALVIFLAFATHQLDLPGLHYDEAKEAGINAMQLLRGQPLTLFRGAHLQVGPLTLPLMVQDYIGALNVYLAIPFLALGGVGVPQLRLLPIFSAALTLIFLYLFAKKAFSRRVAICAVILLAVNPSFIFWSRQGMLVTNITVTMFAASLWTAWNWKLTRRWRWLALTGFIWGVGVWIKLLFIWAIGGMLAVAFLGWLWQWRNASREMRWPDFARNLLVLGSSFLLGVWPLIIFNVQTSGTLISVFSNLNTSYYGVNNANFLTNLAKRVEQVGFLLQGNQFWYLGETYANDVAFWVLGALLFACAWFSRRSASGGAVEWRRLCGILALCGLIVVQSSFTVSDLFIAHYALLLPLIPLAASIAANFVGRRGRFAATLAFAALLAWGAKDAVISAQYHDILSRSGGYAAHSDASYELANYLATHGYSSPIVLDWGIDAPLVYLTQGRVAPVEAFDYARLDAPSEDFSEQIQKLLDNPTNVYLLHTPEFTIFQGRREAIEKLAARQGKQLKSLELFRERSGRPSVEVVQFVMQ